MVENGGFCKYGNKKQKDIPTKTQWNLCNGICVDLTHKYELKLKNKKHQRIKTQQILDQAFKPKTRNKINQEKYY